jgi:hypothetical protein
MWHSACPAGSGIGAAVAAVEALALRERVRQMAMTRVDESAR